MKFIFKTLATLCILQISISGISKTLFDNANLKSNPSQASKSDTHHLNPRNSVDDVFHLIPGGIMVNLDSYDLLMTTANDHSFCLGVRTKGSEEKAINSVFLDSAGRTSTKYKVINKANEIGIESTYGKLTVNLSTKKWSLWNADQKLLIGDGTIISTDTLQSISFPNHLKSYGSGNYNTKDLVKTSSASKMGNGTTDIPYLWNKTGYSLLGIAQNDDKPASWEVNKEQNISWSFKGEMADLYLWPANDIYKATQGLITLTGKPKLPPKWAFGYLQSMWGWRDREFIEDAIENFRSRKLPIDAFIYDFEWYTTFPDYGVKENGAANFSDFSFNHKLFPEPAEQIEAYKKGGIKFIGIRKPRLGDSLRLAMARNNNWIVNSAYNDRDMDFRNPELRNWYIKNNRPLLKAGVDAWWNDEGEAYYTCYYWWNKAQYDLLSSEKENSRFFSINRSFSPGNQRLGYCTWNGDIQSQWKNLSETSADLLNWSLSGMFYGTADIGGFGGKDPDKELVVRWFQTEAFFPIMRAHSNVMTTPRFPWLWDEGAIRKALNIRYSLLPLIYSLGHEAYVSGKPIMRPLLMEFRDDEKASKITSQWLLGSGLMVAPVMNAGGTRKVYLPNDTWYNFFTGEKLQGPSDITLNVAWDEIPVYVRAGTILPIGAVIQNTEEQVKEPLEIRVYPGKNGVFTLVEDDGSSYNYTKGTTRNTKFTWNDKKKELSWKVDGDYTSDHVYTAIKVVIGEQTVSKNLNKKGKLRFHNLAK